MDINEQYTPPQSPAATKPADAVLPDTASDTTAGHAGDGAVPPHSSATGTEPSSQSPAGVSPPAQPSVQTDQAAGGGESQAAADKLASVALGVPPWETLEQVRHALFAKFERVALSLRDIEAVSAKPNEIDVADLAEFVFHLKSLKDLSKDASASLNIVLDDFYNRHLQQAMELTGQTMMQTDSGVKVTINVKYRVTGAEEAGLFAALRRHGLQDNIKTKESVHAMTLNSLYRTAKLEGNPLAMEIEDIAECKVWNQAAVKVVSPKVLAVKPESPPVEGHAHAARHSEHLRDEAN